MSQPSKRIALTTAVGAAYADKLGISLGCNRAYFDEYHVLHGPDDHNSLATMCAEPGVKCHETSNVKQPDGPGFSKGQALGELQKRLHADPDYRGALIVLLNADICLPQNFVLTLPKEPKEDTLYYTTARYIYCDAASLVQRSPDWVETSLSGVPGFLQAYVSPINFTYSHLNSATGEDLSGKAFAKGFRLQQVLQDLRVHKLGTLASDRKRAIGDAGWANPTQFMPQAGVCQACEGFFSASGLDVPWRRATGAFNAPVTFGDLMYN